MFTTIKFSKETSVKQYLAYVMPYLKSPKLNSLGVIGNDYFESYRNLSEFVQSRDRYLLNVSGYEIRIFQNKQGKYDINIVVD